ncbi:hypothetical protein BCV70DRAFT_87005 [Testicularia cyperi]|uniref:Uncharacterized protein n=1 Tax=Testicularia cyperi TaxID=1882483 RepID=A0A317XT83_9BASI|nr:hypothetical protein BCV70DRAFT_87005 [Testicularia cyperi]
MRKVVMMSEAIKIKLRRKIGRVEPNADWRIEVREQGISESVRTRKASKPDWRERERARERERGRDYCICHGQRAQEAKIAVAGQRVRRVSFVRRDVKLFRVKMHVNSAVKPVKNCWTKLVCTAVHCTRLHCTRQNYGASLTARAACACACVC